MKYNNLDEHIDRIAKHMIIKPHLEIRKNGIWLSKYTLREISRLDPVYLF